MDLYSVLDVDKAADKAAIRRAYRKKAKATHPDNQDTGSEKSFALVKLAHDVLTDDERRQKYDSTGDFKEQEPDNTFAEAINLLSVALDQVMHDINETGGLDYITSFNLVHRMNDAMKLHKRSAEKHIKDAEAVLKINEKLEKRFKRRAGPELPNMLEAMIKGRVVTCRDQIEFQRRSIQRTDQALAILEEYEFETEDAMKARPQPSMSPIEAILRGRLF
jgi:curved DNA-binding protein CbpA